jgi:RNA polymerase sigma-32 factor
MHAMPRKRKPRPTEAAPPPEGAEPEAAAEETEPDLDATEPASEDLSGEESAGREVDLPVEDDAAEEPSAGEEAATAGRHEPTRALVPTDRSLVRHDPLTAYVQEIRRFPLLSREDEHAEAVRYFQTGDLRAARRLVEANLRLVVKIAHEYRRAYRNLLDLIQEGNVGLMQAVKKYDPYRGVKLSSYAAWWIRAYILKFILNNWRLVKIGTTQAQRKLFFNLKKEKEKLEREGFVPESKLLAERLNVPEQEVIDMERRLGSAEMSLDAPVGGDDEGGGRTRLDLVQGGTRPDAQVEGREFTELLREKLEAFGAQLAGREKTIFDERMLNDSPLTLQEIGEKYAISRERARQIEARLKVKLEKYLRESLGDAIDVALGRED